jgi:hypothetical protein
MNDNCGGCRGPRGRPRPRRAGLLAAPAGIALLAAGCGGGSTAAGSGADSGSLYSIYTAMKTLARCLDNHGWTAYVSPHNPGSPMPPGVVWYFHWIVAGTDPSAPGYQKAYKACAHLIPIGIPPSGAYLHQQLLRALKGSACVRAHGYPGFPDPNDQPGYIVYPPLPPSIDKSSPQFESAMKACGVWDPPQDQ